MKTAEEIGDSQVQMRKRNIATRKRNIATKEYTRDNKG
jgi:hypothetical protein